MKKFISKILSMISNVDTQQRIASTDTMVNILDYGAIAIDDNSYADVNTNAIITCIDIVNKNNTKGVVYIPAGVFVVNELLANDFRYCSFIGAGKRKSVLKLANNRNKPIIETNLWFDFFIRDIQFNGNNENNPDLESVVKLNSAHCYNFQLDNVYFRDYAKVGLELDNATKLTLNDVDAKYGGVGGIKIKNCLSVVINHSDIEQNKEYGILCESSYLENKDRYLQPLIEINNPYCESNGVGVLLKGICNVKVNGGYNHKGIFSKVTSNEKSYSLFNNFDGKHVGQIIIDKGNYGNIVKTSLESVIDLDGRNYDLSNEVLDNYSKGKQLKFNRSNGHKISYIGDNVELVSTTKNTGVSCYLNTSLKQSNLYLKIKGDLNARLIVRVYDLETKKYLNFCSGLFQLDNKDYNTNFYCYFDNNIKYLKIPLNMKDSVRPRVQITCSSKSEDFSKTIIYGCKLI